MWRTRKTFGLAVATLCGFCMGWDGGRPGFPEFTSDGRLAPLVNSTSCTGS